MRRSRAVAFAALLAAAPLPALADAGPVVAAERAFAADGKAIGFKRSFLKHSAPDAIVLQPDPVNAHQSLAKAPDPKPGDPELFWWPVWAGMARSNDLGFTTGPYRFGGKHGGYYFTVWKKQADGSWKWIYDGGAGGQGDKAPPPPETTPREMAAATSEAGDPEKAKAEVARAEAALAQAAKSDLLAAYQAQLAPDARVQGSPAPPATTPDAVAAEIATRPDMTFSPLAAEASKAGDLVFTYGDARWTKDGKAGRGHYVRMWRNGREGWRLVFDQIVPIQPPAPQS